MAQWQWLAVSHILFNQPTGSFRTPEMKMVSSLQKHYCVYANSVQVCHVLCFPLFLKADYMLPLTRSSNNRDWHSMCHLVCSLSLLPNKMERRWHFIILGSLVPNTEPEGAFGNWRVNARCTDWCEKQSPPPPPFPSSPLPPSSPSFCNYFWSPSYTPGKPVLDAGDVTVNKMTRPLFSWSQLSKMADLHKTSTSQSNQKNKTKQKSQPTNQQTKPHLKFSLGLTEWIWDQGTISGGLAFLWRLIHQMFLPDICY